MHEGQDFYFCGGGGVDGSGKSLTVVVGVVFRRGGGRLFRSGFFMVEDVMFVLGGVFVVVVVEMELVVGCVVKLVLYCSNGTGNFLQHFSLMLVEANCLM